MPAPFPYDHFVYFFPQYQPSADGLKYSPEYVTGFGNRAAMWLTNYDNVFLKGERRIYAHCLLTAHVIYLTEQQEKEAASGGAGGTGAMAVGPVTSASVGGVSVSMQTPQSSGDGPFEWWLNKSPYGQEFLALIRTRGPAVAFVGSHHPVLPLR